MNIWNEALSVLVGGVDSPVRSFSSVGGEPVFFDKGKGAIVVDVKGKKYIDYVCSWGAVILGHAHSSIINAVRKQSTKGFGFGATSELEVLMAKQMKIFLPHFNRFRFVNSGTEATMTALRLARGYTKRKKFVKFIGCYHGHADPFLVKAGSGMLTHGVATSSSLGVPEGTIADTITVPYNNYEALQEVFRQQGGEIAGIIFEPICGNMNFIFPKQEFLDTMQSLCKAYGSLLIADEVMTGFRVAKGGACEVYTINADLACYGKVIGGGLPIGCLSGRDAILDHLAPMGGVYQAGTLSGNPIVMSAGIAVLKELQRLNYAKLSSINSSLKQIITSALTKKSIEHCYYGLGGMFGFHLGITEAYDLEDVNKSNQKLFNRLFTLLLQEGISLAPSSFEAGFISFAHNKAVLEKTAVAFERALKII
ncbi:MAG: glutamate-1-semialdehyde 2,1-aminomutase [Methylacidiphilales bacterium]|nr:glutamate-1-semialdehyde 2,1-aminomutase [Candidatus Methylacidiphilales bacterium]